MYPNDVYLVDTEHMGTREGTGVWLLKGESNVIVDPGPEPSLHHVLEGLEGHGVGGEDIAAVFVTHIHLDHSAGVGRLLEMYPDIEVYVHELGARHLIDPSRLLASAGQLYGERMEELWGKVLSVPHKNVKALKGGERLELGGRTFEVKYTPGHAKHHICFFDIDDRAAYTGDVTGMCFGPARLSVPPTPPPDINTELWLQSIDEIMAWQPEFIRLTHYGQVDEVADFIGKIKHRLKLWTEVAEEVGGRDQDNALAYFTERVREDLLKEYDSETVEQYLLKSRLVTNLSGLQRYLSNR